MQRYAQIQTSELQDALPWTALLGPGMPYRTYPLQRRPLRWEALSPTVVLCMLSCAIDSMQEMIAARCVSMEGFQGRTSERAGGAQPIGKYWMDKSAGLMHEHMDASDWTLTQAASRRTSASSRKDAMKRP